MRKRQKFFDQNLAAVTLFFHCSVKIKAQELVEFGLRNGLEWP
jgi:hypothetical protein